MAENKLQDFRVRYPDYDDLEDDELLELIHRDAYEDMPMDVFREAMGTDQYTEETATGTQQLPQVRTMDTAVDQKLKSGETFQGKPSPDDLESELKEFEDDEPPTEDEEEPGYLSNIGRRIGERAFDVVGDVFKGVSKAIEPVGRAADVAIAKLTTEPGLERDVAVKYQQTRPNFFDIAGDKMKAMDFGSTESETYDELEAKWSNAQGVGDYANAFAETVGWGITEGAASIPDMVGAVYALPAYVVSTDARIAQERATNSGREDFTREDMMAAAPFALGTVLFERYGAQTIAGKFSKSDEVLEEIGKTALERGIQYAKDAGSSAFTEFWTEGVQEGIIEYIGETWGTDKALDAAEGFQRGFWGAIAGGTFGGAAGAASSVAGDLGRAISGDAVPPEFEGDPEYPGPPPEPEPSPEDFGAELDEDIEEDIAPEPEPTELPRVPGDLAELAQQRKLAMDEYGELLDQQVANPDDFPQASQDRLTQLGNLMSELDDEIGFANQEKYGPPPVETPAPAEPDPTDELPVDETEAFDREQFDEALDDAPDALSDSEIVGQLQGAMLNVRNAFPDEDFLGPDDSQIPEMLALVRDIGLQETLRRWYSLSEAELAATVAPAEAQVVTLRPEAGELTADLVNIGEQYDPEFSQGDYNQYLDELSRTLMKAYGAIADMEDGPAKVAAREEIETERGRIEAIIREDKGIEPATAVILQFPTQPGVVEPPATPGESINYAQEFGPYAEVARTADELSRQSGGVWGTAADQALEQYSNEDPIAASIFRERFNLGIETAGPALVTDEAVLEPEDVVEPASPVQGVPEDWKFFDPRMRHPAYRATLEGLREEVLTDQGVGSIIRAPAYTGEEPPFSGPVTGRVTSGNPQWVQDILGGYQMTGRQLRNAITKALEGKRLGSRQNEIVMDMLDNITAERNDPTTLQFWRDELEQRRKERRERNETPVLDDDWIDDVINDNVTDDLDAFFGLTAEEKMIGNLAILLRQKGFDPTPIVDQSQTVAETIRRLEEALHDYETGAEGLAPAGDLGAGGQVAEAQEELLQNPAEHPAKQGQRFVARGWRVQGVRPETIYADQAAGYPIIGQASYTFFDEATANAFRGFARTKSAQRDVIETVSLDVDMQNPFVINSDEDWRSLAVTLAGNVTPNPRRFEGEAEQRKSTYVNFAKRIRDYLESAGHDGVVVQWDNASPNDFDGEYSIKTLRNVFDEPQIIWFGESQAGIAAELDKRRTDSGATDLSDLPLFGTPQDDIYDMPGVDARGEPDGPPAQVQDVISILEELSKVNPDEGYELPPQSVWAEMQEDMEVNGWTPTDVVFDWISMNREEQIAVEEIYGQMLLARGNPTDDTKAPEDNRERRNDQELRNKIEAMTPEERFEALYMDDLTGLGNKRYMEETLEGVPFFAFMDVDNLAVVNNFLGHEGGDKLLERTGEVIGRLTEQGQAFHPHGDEFILFGDSVEELEALTAAIDAELTNSFIATEIGKLNGLSGTWGIDRTIATADREMEANKLRRIERGERVERGAKPDNLEIAGTSEPEIQKAIMPMQPGAQYVPLISKYGQLPINRDGQYILSDGRRVRIPKKPVRKVHVLKRMQQRFGLTIWQGRIKGPRTELGYYKTPGGEIRTKFHNDLEVSAHEIAHWFDDRFPFISALYNKAPFKKELQGVSYNVKKVSEGFAEYMRLWFTQEHQAIEAAPYFHDAFMQELEDSHPELYKNMRDLQEMSHAWYLQGAEGRFDSKIGNPHIPLAIRWWDARHHASDFVLQKIFDGFRRVKQVERDVRGFVADAEHSPYKNFRMVKQSSELTQYVLERGTIMLSDDGREMQVSGESLKGALEGVDDQLDNWIRYAVAMRARELHNQGRESGFRPDEIQAGLAYGADPAIREAHARYLAWNTRMMDFYERMGLVGPETRAAMEAMNRDYIPFQRIIEAFRSGKVQQKGGVFPRLKGSTRNIKDVLDSIVSNTSYLIHMALVNESKQLLYDMIDASPVPQSAANWAVKVEKEVAPVPIAKEQIERAIVQGMGYTMNQWKMMKDGMVEDEIEEQVVKKVSTALDTMDDFVTFWQLGVAPQGNIDIVYREGEKNYYDIADKMLLDSIQHTSPKAMNLALKIVAGFSSTLRRGVVTWPGFQVSNFLRDSMQAWQLAKGQKVPLVGAAKEVLKGFVNDTDYWSYILNGGGMSTLAQAEGEGQRVMDLGFKSTNPRQAWRNFLRLYDRKIGTFEYGNRINEFKRQQKLGKSPRESAFQGREISTDFAMRGSSNTVRAATLAITFLNARMQGGYRLGRALFEIPPNQRPKFVSQTALSYFLKGFVGLSIPSMILFAFNWGDDRYRDMPPYMRRQNWVIFYGPDEDDYALIPKPFETGFFWATMWEASLEYLYTNDQSELADAIVWTLAETFAIDVIPQAIKPIDELRTNKKWTGAPVIPEYLKGVEPELQYQQYTSDAVIKYANKIGVSPMAAQHLIEGWLGTSGQYGLAVADFFTQDQANGGQEIAGPHLDENDKALFEAWGRTYYEDLPMSIADSILLERFIDHGPLKRTHSQDKFYELLKEARITANSVRLMQLNDPERLREYLNAVDDKFYFATSSSIEEIAAKVNKISAQMDLVARTDTMSGIAKRQVIQDMQRQKNMAYKQAAEQLNVDDYRKAMKILDELIPAQPDPALN